MQKSLTKLHRQVHKIDKRPCPCNSTISRLPAIVMSCCLRDCSKDGRPKDSLSSLCIRNASAVRGSSRYQTKSTWLAFKSSMTCWIGARLLVNEWVKADG